MSKRVALTRRLGASTTAPLAQSSEAHSVARDPAEVEATAEITLPREHPKWAKDRFTVSAATKRWLDGVAPFVIRVFGFWDHRVHRLDLEGVTVEVDASGSYRSDFLPPAL